MCEVTPPNHEQANQETPLEPRPWPGSRRSKPKTRKRQDYKKYGSPKQSAIQRGVAREQGVEIVARFVDKATQNLLGPLQSQSGTSRVRRQIEPSRKVIGLWVRCPDAFAERKSMSSQDGTQVRFGPPKVTLVLNGAVK